MVPGYKFVQRFISTSKLAHTKVCIIGAGPAGFYAAQHLLKKLKTEPPIIDMYEKLPVPFGLVRFGVAPDHPDVKNVIKTFTKTAENPHFNFYGNVNLGQDIRLEQLMNAYHVVLLTYGAEQSNILNIPGIDKKNCIEARRVVGWYNGIPWDVNLDIDLTGEVATIFGQGNVAIDVARMLLTPVDQLKKTDITQYSLEMLSKSRIRKVYLVGRRGPLQAAYTIKELREMLRLEGCNTIWKKDDFQGIQDVVPNLERPRKRITELMLENLAKSERIDNGKEFRPIFHRSPINILGFEKVEGVELGVNKLVGEDLLKKRAVMTDAKEVLESSLAIPSIGYKAIQADSDLPFDTSRGIVKNANGKISKGLYSSGWLSTGPTGVILSTMSNAFEVANLIMHDISKEDLISVSREGSEEILKELHRKNVQIVSWEDWEKIDRAEQKEGAKVGKPREKIVDIEKMLEIAAS